MIISPQEWVFFIIFVPFAYGEVFMKVTAFNKSEAELSCRYESHANQTAVHIEVFQRDFSCLYRTADHCLRDVTNKCNIYCLDKVPEDINILPFRVSLIGSCEGNKDIRCHVGLNKTGKSEEEASIDLSQESDPPVIHINDTKPIEASCTPVEIKCTVKNLCYRAQLKIFDDTIQEDNTTAILDETTTTHETEGSRFTAIATTKAHFVEAGNYTIGCIEKKNKDRSSKRSLTVYRPSGVECPGPTSVKKDRNITAAEGNDNDLLFNDLTIGTTTIAVAAVLGLLVIMLWFLKRRLKDSDRNMQHLALGRSEGNEKAPQERKPPGVSELEDSICGIWVKEDEKDGEKISSRIIGSGKKVRSANVYEESFVLEIPKFTVYFALISSHSLNNLGFLACLRLILWRMSNWKYDTIPVLVLVEKEDSLNLSDYVDANLVTGLEVRRVKALSKLDDCLPQLARKLRVPKLPEASYGIGDIGVGLAWNYYYGFLALVLPKMREKIVKSDMFKRTAKMSPVFIIIIPLSSQTPTKLSNVDARISTIGLFDEFKKSRAGQPERPYKTFLHQIELNSVNHDDLYFFCGEYSAPVLSLNKMLVDGNMTQVEMAKQIQLFIETLESILQSDPCGENASVLSFTDVSTLAEDLCGFIKNPHKKIPNIETAAQPVTKVAEGLALSYFYNYLTIIGPTLADRIEHDEYFIKGNMPTKLFILLPYSCSCYAELKGADKGNIKTVGKLQRHLVENVAGNERTYDIAIHQISAGTEKYFACVEYCTPVLVMYEMAKHQDQTGLSPLQKAVELRIFYDILSDLLQGASASEYCDNFQLVYYNDHDGIKLSTKLVDKIKRSLDGEHHVAREAVTYDNHTQAAAIENV